MLEPFSEFMIFEVKDNGEEFRLNTTEEAFKQNNGNKVLHSLQVVVIIKEALRRIFIWKGLSSSVRKKFIASRVASDLQRRLIDSYSFHRCKIISVDQGDEPEEFLNAFGFKKVHVPVNPTIPYDLEIKNYNTTRKEKQEYTSKFSSSVVKPRSENTTTYQELKKTQNSRNILEKILKEKIPENFKRTNIIVGTNALYGQITKKTEIFKENVEIKEWELISNFPRQIIELDGQKLRIYLNIAKKEIDAIEILEKIKPEIESEDNVECVDYDKWTVKQLKEFCRGKGIRLLSSYRKADIVKFVREYTKSG